MSHYSLDEIWQAYCNHEEPDAKFLEDLIWHIENDKKPGEAMSVATDLARQEAIPAITKQLNNPNYFVRERAAGYLCRLLAYGHPEIDTYAAKLYRAAKYDDYISNRTLIASFMESILDVVGSEMRIQIAELILEYAQLSLGVKFAYDAMLHCIGEKYDATEIPPIYPDFVDEEKVQKFRIKYNV